MAVGVAVGVWVGSGVCAAVAVGVLVGVWVGLGASVAVAVGVVVDVGCGVSVGVLVGVNVTRHAVETLEAVAVRPSNVHTRLLPLKTTLNAAFGQYGVRPGWNIVGCPRSSGTGENLLSEPIGIVTVTAFSL